MKYLYTFLAVPALFASLPSNAQQSKTSNDRLAIIGISYEAGLPQGGMKDGLHALHTLKLGVSFPLQRVCPNLEAGFELGYGIYGMKTFEVNYNFSGNYINTDVVYNSSVTQLGLNANYFLCREGVLQPYVALKAGWAGFFSSFQVEDPNDPLSCKVVERRNIAEDGSMYWGYGGGFRVKVKGDRRGSNYLDFSVQKIAGGEVKYVNVNRLQHQHEPYVSANGTTPVKFSFVNASTQQVHEHTIAELYKDPLKMLQLKLSWVAELGW